jgi:hypothetical protein
MPVTNGGKNLVIREKTGVINNPINAALQIRLHQGIGQHDDAHAVDGRLA